MPCWRRWGLCLLHCTMTLILQYLRQAWPKTFNYSEMSLSDIHLTVFLWSGLVILRVSPFHSPNSLGIYHKMYTFGSFVCSGRPDMWYLCEPVLWHARLSCSEDFRKREYFQPIYFRLYNMLSFKWHMFKFTTCICLIGSYIYTIFQPIYNTVQHVFSDTTSILVFKTIVMLGVP